MFSLLWSHKPTQRYNPPPGAPPQAYNPPPGAPPQAYNPPPGPPPSPQHYRPPSGPPPSLSLAPPGYAPAAGQSHETSESNATLGDYETADLFCRQHPKISPAKVFPPNYKDFDVDEWGLVLSKDPTRERGMTSISVEFDKPSFGGPNHRLVLTNRNPETRVAHYRNRGDACLISNLPIIAGQYSNAHKRGVYFEITIRELRENGTLALGMQCLPYPPHRLPGWHRMSAALHLDDRRLYFEDSEGGKDYLWNGRDSLPPIKASDTLGCGYEFKLNGGVGHLFYTYNGKLLPIAFPGIFDPVPGEGEEVDVFAAVGVTDGPSRFDVNFGLESFKWSGPSHSHKGTWNSEDWSVKGLFRQFGDGPPQYDS
ncbi:hypothetical protein C8F04DRAFT_1188600 [Mycena alexandri]|uniref:SPRY domain-containing protein n=1 Tax=Mycena alexandri TaxID=1745969 RepID=A0AAD6WYS0_9AGAR|nr:hypothetical protein C8F04DRAFT_1188600 [Mycena alexandri]